MRWNWTTGEWENPINKANVIGLAAAGGVGGAFAAPVIAGAVGGAGAGAGSGYVGADVAATAAATNAAGAGAVVPSVLASTAGGGASTARQILQGATGTGGKMGAYDWLGPVVNASLNLIGNQQQIGATADAAQKQLEATKYAADAQAKAAAEALAFQRQQAAYDAVSAESTRAANYDQWAAKQQQLGSVGQALGLPARAIPAYVPIPSAGGAPPPTAPGAGSPGSPGSPDAAWWNPQDAQGSVAALFAGAPPTSQAILDRRAQIEAAGGQVSPANQEGVTSKIYLPGVGWTRVLDGGVKGGQGTGWTFVPQGVGGGAPVVAQGAPVRAPVMADPLGSVQQYFLDPTQARGQLQLPTGRLGSVASYF
jgi:hypothetical protein